MANQSAFPVRTCSNPPRREAAATDLIGCESLSRLSCGPPAETQRPEGDQWSDEALALSMQGDGGGGTCFFRQTVGRRISSGFSIALAKGYWQTWQPGEVPLSLGPVVNSLTVLTLLCSIANISRKINVLQLKRQSSHLGPSRNYTWV